MKLTVALTVLAMTIGIFFLRCQSSRQAAPVMMQLRDQILRSSPTEFGMGDDEHKPYVAVMDVAMPNAVVSLVTAVSGDASLYFSSGGGVVGGFGYPPVREAATAFVHASGRYDSHFAPAGDIAHPALGQVRFFARYPNGIRVATASVEELESGRHPLSPLFMDAQKVITQLRLATAGR